MVRKKNARIFRWMLLLSLSLAVASCAGRKQKDEGDELRLGKVQQEIKVGMNSSKVVEALGSPNMVTMDGENGEVWVYDRVSTRISESSGGAGLILFFASSTESSISQKSFTVIIKFDKKGRVRDVSYHSSKF